MISNFIKHFINRNQKAILILFILNIQNLAFSQIPSNNSVFAKQWSQDLTLTMAKLYLVQNVISVGESEEYLILDAINAASSGEITTVCYSGDSSNSIGALFAFYGNYWNENGVQYKGYAFKNLKSIETLTFLKKIIAVSEKYQKFMDSSFDNNNMIFTFEDLTIIMFSNGPTKLRVLWQDFDAEWTIVDVKKTLNRFEEFTKE